MSLVCPEKNCPLCPRLVEFRHENQKKYPTYFNSPVPAFGSLDSEILIIGLAPGLNGANQTGRPFTGDYAGDILYPALKDHGFAKGNYERHRNDGFELINVRITNGVKCVPPQNKVVAQEVNSCRQFLMSELDNMPNLKLVLSLGSVAHNAFLSALGYAKTKFKFAHNTCHILDKHSLKLLNSYHTSRYNINTGVLT